MKTWRVPMMRKLRRYNEVVPNTYALQVKTERGDLVSFLLPNLPSPDNPSDQENRLISAFMKKSLDSEDMVL